MIDRSHAFPIKGQAKMLSLSRSTVYYKPRPVSAEELDMIRWLDELYLDHPFAGARMLRDLLRLEGHPDHRKINDFEHGKLAPGRKVLVHFKDGETITIEFELARNVNEAANDVRDRISRIRGRLPAEAEDPVVERVLGGFPGPVVLDVPFVAASNFQVMPPSTSRSECPAM